MVDDPVGSAHTGPVETKAVSNAMIRNPNIVVFMNTLLLLVEVRRSTHSLAISLIQSVNDGGEPANASYGYLWWTRTTRDGLLAYFAAGYQCQLILNFPDRNLVIALSSGSTLPGGAAKFINDVLLPAEAPLPAGAACVGRLDQ